MVLGGLSLDLYSQTGHGRESVGSFSFSMLADLIKVQEVDSERYQELQAMAFDKNGAYSLKEARKVNLLLVCAGMIEPSLSDKDLQAHFGAATPKDLADKLLKGIDATLVADKISELSNFTLGNDEKNE